MKYLIINADDFGMSAIFNDAILDLLAKKLVLSTTVMVDRVTNSQRSQIDALIALSKKMNLSIGLHLEFKDTNYANEIKSQFQKFKEIIGFIPSHIDIHKAHSLTESFPYAAEFCKEKGLPLRNSGRIFEGVKTTPSEAFFGSVDNFGKIEEWVKTFKEGQYYEVMFHPGRYDPDVKSSLNKERERDVEYVKKLNSILKENNIKLINYFDFVNK